MAHHDVTDLGGQVIEQLPKVTGLESWLREAIPRLVYVSALGWMYLGYVTMWAIGAAISCYAVTAPIINTSYLRISLAAPLPSECHWREQQSVNDAVSMLASTLAVSGDTRPYTWRKIPVETWLDVDVQSPLVIVQERFRPIRALDRRFVALSKINPFGAKLALDDVPSSLMSRINMSDFVGPCVKITELAHSPAFAEPPRDFLPLLAAGGVIFLLVIPRILLRFIQMSYLRTYSREILQDEEVQEICQIPYFENFRKLDYQAVDRDQNSGDPASELDLYRETMSTLAMEVSALILECRSNVILVTSIDSGVGKSAMARGLTYAFQRSGKKCLLIDADLRRGRQYRHFGIERDPGVSTIISGQSSFEAAVRSPKSLDGWSDFMSNGMQPPNPAELLRNMRFEEIIEKAQKLYDYVIVDLPPTIVADPWIVAKISSLILLVVPRQIRVVDKVLYLGKLRLLKKRGNPVALVTSSVANADWDDHIPASIYE